MRQRSTIHTTGALLPMTFCCTRRSQMTASSVGPATGERPGRGASGSGLLIRLLSVDSAQPMISATRRDIPRTIWNLETKLRMPTQSSGLNAGAFFSALPRMLVIAAMTEAELSRAFSGLQRERRNGAYRVE